MKRILPIYPWPVHPVVQAEIEKIVDLEAVQATPGGVGPVLAIRKLPPFMADVILVEKPQMLSIGIQIAMGDGLRMVTVRDMVSDAMNAEHPLNEETQAKINKSTGPVFR